VGRYNFQASTSTQEGAKGAYLFNLLALKPERCRGLLGSLERGELTTGDYGEEGGDDSLLKRRRKDLSSHKTQRVGENIFRPPGLQRPSEGSVNESTHLPPEGEENGNHLSISTSATATGLPQFPVEKKKSGKEDRYIMTIKPKAEYHDGNL